MKSVLSLLCMESKLLLISFIPALPTAQKCGSQRTPRDMAHLQAHKVSEASKSWTGANTSKEIPAGYLCVSPLQSDNSVGLCAHEYARLFCYVFPQITEG